MNSNLTHPRRFRTSRALFGTQKTTRKTTGELSGNSLTPFSDFSLLPHCRTSLSLVMNLSFCLAKDLRTLLFRKKNQELLVDNTPPSEIFWWASNWTRCSEKKKKKKLKIFENGASETFGLSQSRSPNAAASPLFTTTPNYSCSKTNYQPLLLPPGISPPSQKWLRGFAKGRVDPFDQPAGLPKGLGKQICACLGEEIHSNYQDGKDSKAARLSHWSTLVTQVSLKTLLFIKEKQMLTASTLQRILSADSKTRGSNSEQRHNDVNVEEWIWAILL